MLATGAILAGCGSADEVAAPTPGTEPFLEDLAARLVLPADISGELPLVVLVPGEYFPVPVEDVACGSGYAVETVEGLDVSTIDLGGHSSGANMAALVALAPDEFDSADCRTSPQPPMR